MVDHAEFSAHELDHLEDALEGLELAPPVEGAPQIRRRLEEYRNILTLSRAAMPMVEVPRGLLDGVLAEARASVETPAITPSVAAPQPESFWSKLRKFALLPGVALAGTAAVVLFMVDRKDETAAQVVAASKADAKVATAVEQRKNDEGERAAEAPAPGAAATGSRAAAAEPAPPPAPTSTPVAPAAAPEPEVAERKREDAAAERQEESPNDDGDAQAGLGGAKQDKKVADAETPRWDIIARGDRARHRGDCKVARNEYALALDDVDTRVRARAHAGLGLCDAAEGDRKSADAAYTAARELDGEIVAFIDDERPRAAGTSPAKAKPKAASKKSKSDTPPEQQQNALEGL
jgi:hypothetical protein